MIKITIFENGEEKTIECNSYVLVANGEEDIYKFISLHCSAIEGLLMTKAMNEQMNNIFAAIK